MRLCSILELGLHLYGSNIGSLGEHSKILFQLLSSIALIHNHQNTFSNFKEFATKALNIYPNHNKFLFRRAAAQYETSLSSHFVYIIALSKGKNDLKKCKFDNGENQKAHFDLQRKVFDAIEVLKWRLSVENY